MATAQDALQIGWKLHQARDFRGAEAIYRRVLAAQPDSADAWCFLGILHYDEKHYAESIAAYQHALQLRPTFPIASSNLSNSLSALGRLDEAERAVRRALQWQPEYTTAWTNLGAILVKQGRFPEASQAFEQALALAPQNETAHRNLGAVLIRQGKLSEGTQHSEAALRLNPRSAEAHRNRAIVRLLLGDFEQGWDEYEWRWQCPDQQLPSYAQPLWQGEPLEGRTLLLHAEQGLGDTLQFVRYARLARARGGRVVLQCQAPLVPLLRSYPHLDGLVARGAALPHFDVHLPLLSAPRVCGTRLATIPADVPYLAADPQRVERWRERLAGYGPLCVGLAWQGSRDHHADRQRSLSLAQLLPLAMPGVTFISLQKGPGSEQAAEFAGPLNLVDLGDQLDASDGAFLDTAAVMTLLDVVITVDTAIAHLAGALAVPVWTLLPHAPDWRWLLERTDTPWYPTMRLWRQPQPDDWSTPLERLRAALAERLASVPPPGEVDHDIRQVCGELEALDAAGQHDDRFLSLVRRLLQWHRQRQGPPDSS